MSNQWQEVLLILVDWPPGPVEITCLSILWFGHTYFPINLFTARKNPITLSYSYPKILHWLDSTKSPLYYNVPDRYENIFKDIMSFFWNWQVNWHITFLDMYINQYDEKPCQSIKTSFPKGFVRVFSHMKKHTRVWCKLYDLVW